MRFLTAVLDFDLMVTRSTVPKSCGSFRGSEFVNLLTYCRLGIQCFQPLRMNARARIRQPIKNVTHVNERLFVLFIIQVISVINKIIYFSAQIVAERGFDGMVRSTV